MKVGIIGLKPRQIATLNTDEHNKLTVVCYNEKRMSNGQVESFCHDKDKVLVLVQAVASTVLNAVPKEKRIVLKNNTNSTVKRELESLQLSAVIDDMQRKPQKPEPLDQLPNWALAKPKPKGDKKHIMGKLADVAPISPVSENTACPHSTEELLTSTERAFIAEVSTVVAVPEDQPKSAHFEERQFWREVYLAKISMGSGNTVARRLADEALVEHRERFKL